MRDSFYFLVAVLLFSSSTRLLFTQKPWGGRVLSGNESVCTRSVFEPYASLLEPQLIRSSEWRLLCDRSVSHEGTLGRLASALQRGILRGEIVVGIAGGSCSVGTMCDDSVDHRWYRKMKALLENVLSSRGQKVSVRLVNLSEGGTGADRVFYCLDEFKDLMNVSTLDVLILEYAINDPTAIWIELLIRRLPMETGVFFLETFSAAPHTQQRFGTSQIFHDSLARFYDVPVVSARDALWEVFRRQPDVRSAWLAQDEHHPSCFGHSTLGIFAAELLLRAMKRSATPPSAFGYDGLLDVSDDKPPQMLESSRPSCMFASVGSANECGESFDGFNCERLKNPVNRFHEWGGPNSSWTVNNSRKPSFDCLSSEDGELVIPVDCTDAIHGGSRDFCQVVIGFIKSWKPRGTALVIREDGTNLTIDAHEAEWSRQHYTILWYTPVDTDFLKLPTGKSHLRIACTGLTTASEKSLEDQSTLFQLSSVVVL